MSRFSDDRKSSTILGTAAVSNMFFCKQFVVLIDKMSFGVSAKTDEIALYNFELFSDSSFASITQIGRKIKYWFTKRSSFPALSKVAWRLLVVPVLSVASERNFSALNRLALCYCKSHKTDIAAEISFFNSFNNFFKQNSGQTVL